MTTEANINKTIPRHGPSILALNQQTLSPSTHNTRKLASIFKSNNEQKPGTTAATSASLQHVKQPTIRIPVPHVAADGTLPNYPLHERGKLGTTVGRCASCSGTKQAQMPSLLPGRGAPVLHSTCCRASCPSLLVILLKHDDGTPDRSPLTLTLTHHTCCPSRRFDLTPLPPRPLLPCRCCKHLGLTGQPGIRGREKQQQKTHAAAANQQGNMQVPRTGWTDACPAQP